LPEKKVTQENGTPLPLHPSVLAQRWGGCGTRAFSAQTVLAAYHLSLKPKAWQGEIKTS
jgi:hypothetical protein